MNSPSLSFAFWVRVVTKTMLVGAAAALLGTGCKSTPKYTRGQPVPWTIKLTKATPDSVEVDLFGVNRLEDNYWRNAVRMDDYCKPNSEIRQAVLGRAKSWRFDGPGEFVLDAKDPLWAKWLGENCYQLAIMANMPGNFPNASADPRRTFLLLGKKEWVGKTLEVEILRGYLRVTSTPKP